MPDQLPHTIQFTTKDGSRTAYRVVVSDELDRTVSSEAGELTSDHAAMGLVAAGADAYRYGGRKKTIETNDLDNLMISVNGGGPHPARAFDVAREADFSQEFPGLADSGGGESPSGGGSSGAQNESRTADANAEYFEEKGFDVVDIEGDELPELVHDVREKTAFRLNDPNPDIDGTIECRKQIVVFGRADEEPPEIKLGEHFEDGADLFVFRDGSQGWELRNLAVDVTDSGKGVMGVRAFAGGTARNVHIRGESDDNDGETGAVATYIPRGESVELVRFRAPDGASRTESVPSPKDSVGVIMTGLSDGLLRMHNCEVSEFPNNGVYASGPTKKGHDGRAVITNHRGGNSDRDQLRVGGNSVIDGAELWADKQKPGFNNFRGVWVRYSRGAHVRNVSFHQSVGDRDPAVYVDSTSAQVFLSDINAQLDSNSRAILAVSPSANAGGGQTDVDVSGLTVRGDEAHKESVLVEDRPDSELRGVDIQRAGDGVRFVGPRGVVRESAVDVDGDAFENCDVR